MLMRPLAELMDFDPNEGLVYYSGVGSRRCEDPETLALMTRFAAYAARRGFVLRSGAAPGPDTAFEQGAPRSLRRIYIPNPTFGKRPPGDVIVPKSVDLMKWLKAGLIAERHHGLGNRMTPEVRDLMTRNVYQVLGDNLKTPSRFLICDAPFPEYDDQGRVKNVDGGTGMAVRLAYTYDVPVFHLGTPEHRAQVEALLAEPEPSRAPRLR